jgi:hypothetical protein
MDPNITSEKREKIAELISKMLSLSIGVKVVLPDYELVDIYLKCISNMNNSPIKSLLLLEKEFFIESVYYHIKPNSDLISWINSQCGYDSLPEDEDII